ncbi:MAG: elongation factor P [Bacilli bacterium]|jgi:elongation factor P|nr:elongation factor P [Bacilli bacterium]
MADMIMIGDCGPGTSFKVGDDIFESLKIDHNKTAMRQMIVKIKCKNLRTGAIKEQSFNGDDKVERIYLDKKQMMFEYDDGSLVHFMDSETFNDFGIPKERLTWEENFITADNPITVTFFGEEILGVELPAKVTLKIVDTDDNATAGDTINKAMKEAKVETGYKLKVPMFVKNGTAIVIRTDTGEYDSRA